MQSIRAISKDTKHFEDTGFTGRARSFICFDKENNQALRIPTAYSHFEDSEVSLKSSAFRRTQQVSASILLSLPWPYLIVKLKDETYHLVGYPLLHPQPSFRHLSGLCTSEFILSYLDEWRRSQGSTPLEASTHVHLFQRATPSLCTPARLPGPTLCCKRTK